MLVLISEAGIWVRKTYDSDNGMKNQCLKIIKRKTSWPEINTKLSLMELSLYHSNILFILLFQLLYETYGIIPILNMRNWA